MSNAISSEKSAKLKKLAVPVAALLTLALLFLPMKFGREQLIWDRFSDACHFPLFLLISLAIAYLLHRRGVVVQQATLIAFVVTAIFAGAVEGIQPFTGRSASWVDLRNGLLGAFFGAAALLVYVKRPANGLYIWLFPFLLVSLFLARTIYSAWEIVRWQQHEFPVLATFSNENELLLWRAYGGDELKSAVEIVAAVNGENNQLLKLTTGTGEWLGVEFKVNGLSWADYQNFKFTIINPGADFDLGLRVDDNKKCKRFVDRFNASVPIHPGPNKISIPIKAIADGPENRELNIKRISRVLFFVAKAELPQVIYIDDVHLD